MWPFKQPAEPSNPINYDQWSRLHDRIDKINFDMSYPITEDVRYSNLCFKQILTLIIKRLEELEAKRK